MDRKLAGCLLSAPPGRTLRRLVELGWLAEQPAEFQARIAAAGRWMSHPAGTLLYAEGDEGAALYGLGEGLLDVAIAVSPTEEITLHRAGPGFWIGESAVLAGETRGVTLRTAAESEVLRVPAAAIHRMLQDQPADWMHFYRLSHRNTMLAMQVLAEVLSLRPQARFARLLLRLAGPDGTVSATQEEIGRMAGMSRAGFRRALGKLIRSGVVVTRYGGVRIADSSALKAAARGD